MYIFYLLVEYEWWVVFSIQMEHQFCCVCCLYLPTWNLNVCTSNGQCHPKCSRYRTHIIPTVVGMPDIHTYPLVPPSVDSAHLSPGQKTWLTLEWSGYHFALKVYNQTAGLSQFVHCSLLYNGVRLYSLAHPSRLGNAVDTFYSAWVYGVLRNSIFPLKWTTHPHQVSGNGPCLPK